MSSTIKWEILLWRICQRTIVVMALCKKISNASLLYMRKDVIKINLKKMLENGTFESILCGPTREKDFYKLENKDLISI